MPPRRRRSYSPGAGLGGAVARATGFTLMEVLVVTFILAMTVGLVVSRLTRDDRDLVRDEADRLTGLLQTANEEAILQGGLRALEMTADGYRFLQLGDKGKMVALATEPFLPHQLPPRMRTRLDRDGQPIDGPQAIVFDPSGTLPAFNIAFILNDSRWCVVTQQDGKIQSKPGADCDAK